MYAIINKFILAGDKFIPEMHGFQWPGFTYSAVHLLKLKNEKKLKKQGIHDIFIKTNYIKLAFIIIWLLEVLKI